QQWTRGELALADRIFRPRRSRRALHMADWVIAGIAGLAGARGLPDDGAMVRHSVYRKCDRRLARRGLGQYGEGDLLFLDGRARHGCWRGRCPTPSSAQIDCRRPSGRVVRLFMIGLWQWPGGSSSGPFCFKPSVAELYTMKFPATSRLFSAAKSGVGQSRTSADVCDRTAPPPIADMLGSRSDVAAGQLGVRATQFTQL